MVPIQLDAAWVIFPENKNDQRYQIYINIHAFGQQRYTVTDANKADPSTH